MNVSGQLSLLSSDHSSVPPLESGSLSELTNNQKALVFYYFLRVCDVNPRVTVDLSTIARGMHLLLGKEFTTIDNSGLYKCLQSVPDLNNPQALLRDLARIQPLFAQVGLKAALQLMEYDLALAFHR